MVPISSRPRYTWGPFRGPSSGSEREALDRLDVRGLRALGALHDLELHALALGERLVAVHRDRGEVDEDVLATLTLDEPVALLVRKPLHGALSQLSSFNNTKRRPGHRAAEPTLERPESSVRPWGTQARRGGNGLRGQCSEGASRSSSAPPR